VTGEWRKLQKQGAFLSVLLNQYFSGNKIENNKMGGACSMHGKKESCVKVFGGQT
jgi:hypothetical protein